MALKELGLAYDGLHVVYKIMILTMYTLECPLANHNRVFNQAVVCNYNDGLHL